MRQWTIIDPDSRFLSLSIVHCKLSICYTKGVISVKQSKKGFTLIEMLVVIAIIAVLVSIVIPTVSSATTKAQAATDAANLRSTLGALNTEILLNHEIAEEFISAMEPTESKLFPGCKLYVVYTIPGIIDVYYVDTVKNEYYGLAYLSDIAVNGTTTLLPDPPTLRVDDIWYEVGVGKVG